MPLVVITGDGSGAEAGRVTARAVAVGVGLLASALACCGVRMEDWVGAPVSPNKM